MSKRKQSRPDMMCLDMPLELRQQATAAAVALGLTRAEFIRRATRYAIDSGVLQPQEAMVVTLPVPREWIDVAFRGALALHLDKSAGVAPRQGDEVLVYTADHVSRLVRAFTVNAVGTAIEVTKKRLSDLESIGREHEAEVERSLPMPPTGTA